jgi:hypothetical protein
VERLRTIRQYRSSLVLRLLGLKQYNSCPFHISRAVEASEEAEASEEGEVVAEVQADFFGRDFLVLYHLPYMP